MVFDHDESTTEEDAGNGNDAQPDTNGDGDGGNGDSGAGGYEQERVACVNRINAFRATENLPELERWQAAESCTDEQSESDSRTGKAHGEFGDCGELAQNECPGWPSVSATIQGCLQMMWDEGPGEGPAHGHYVNMSNKRYTRVACGFFERADGEVWAIQNFK